MPLTLDARAGDFNEAFARFLNARRDDAADVEGVVREIIDDVRKRGDDAVIELTARFDGVTLTPETLRVPEAEIQAARAQCASEILDALSQAAERIAVFHQRQLPEDLTFKDEAGAELGHRWTPVGAVGLYVPGGKASYPSSVLMNAIPARVAGVERIVMVVPAPGGTLNPLVLAAAEIAGVTEVYRIGGAQAVAALAYGTNTIAPVDKITGPGNAYVAEAKRQVFGVVGIDMIAGPSEILVVADGQNDPDWIAADLLSQAEHDQSAQSILITDDETFARAVEAAVEEQLLTLPKAEIARASWDAHGAIIVLERLDDAVPLVDALAPEHLELAVEESDALADRISNAGAMFLGRYTPEAIGDYVAGPNHVLPTGRSARFSSGLSVLDFMKRTSRVRLDRPSIAKIGPAAISLAEAEGLKAHARSVAIRLKKG